MTESLKQAFGDICPRTEHSQKRHLEGCGLFVCVCFVLEVCCFVFGACVCVGFLVLVWVFFLSDYSIVLSFGLVYEVNFSSLGFGFSEECGIT